MDEDIYRLWSDVIKAPRKIDDAKTDSKSDRGQYESNRKSVILFHRHHRQVRERSSVDTKEENKHPERILVPTGFRGVVRFIYVDFQPIYSSMQSFV